MDGPREAPHVAVVGAGWAGLAAAVHGLSVGARVTLYEMARSAGGRARTLGQDGLAYDNGQHILIGAYTATLALMRRVGASPEALFWRGPLALVGPDGRGLRLPPGLPSMAFARAVMRQRDWRWRERWALLRRAAGWRLQGFRCPPDWTVARLCEGLPETVQQELIEPLCVAGLNTPMASADARVFLRVMRDALFSGPGSADLLLPRAPLSNLLPEPALDWLRDRHADIRLGWRVGQLQPGPGGTGWLVDGEAYDAVVLACSAVEAARLAQAVAPPWSAAAKALAYQPIVTVWLHDQQLRLPRPMLRLPAGTAGPAQFVFDLRQLGQPDAGFAFVASAASPALAAGLPSATQAVVSQARAAFPGAFAAANPVLHMAAERRATFACVPGLPRPTSTLAPALAAAGDYVDGPYPATLEGAVRSGLAAVRQVLGDASAASSSEGPMESTGR